MAFLPNWLFKKPTLQRASKVLGSRDLPEQSFEAHSPSSTTFAPSSSPPSATDSAYSVEIAQRMDFIGKLPIELSIQILIQLSPSSLFSLFRVCKTYHYIILDNELWRQVFYHTFGHVFMPNHPLLWRLCNGRLVPPPKSGDSALFTGIVAPSPLLEDPPTPLNWQTLTRQKLILDQNWSRGIVEPGFITGHADSVYCIQYDNHQIVSGSRDKLVKFWSMDSEGGNALKGQFSGHEGSVLCLQYDADILVTGSSDKTIIVWDMKTGQRKMRLLGHEAPVLDVKFEGRWIVSCSKDMTIRVWNIETGICRHVFEGHAAAVNAIHLCDGRIVSASGDCLIKMWDIATFSFVRDFSGHTRGLACVQYSDGIIISGSNDRSIKIWNAMTGECVRTLTGHTDLVRTLSFDRERIVSGSYDQTIKIWDMRTGALLHDFRDAHTSWVFHVQLSGTKIVSASQDRKIVVWDFGHNVSGASHVF